jgi:hypothetical protein
MAKEKEGMAEERVTGAAVPRVNWDASAMSTSYANVVNVSSTREEVTLLFGTNITLFTGQEEVTVKLSDRIILSPFAAKRLKILLDNVMGEYEKRFGQLNIETRIEPPASPATKPSPEGTH